jgi:PilZ domain
MSSGTPKSPKSPEPPPASCSRAARDIENRFHIRFNKAFPVIVISELYGDTRAVARNISAGGMFIEMADPPPLGSVVTVCFPAAGDEELRARGEVKHHYCFNYGDESGEAALARGIGLRFLEFSPDGEHPESWLPPPSRALH